MVTVTYYLQPAIGLARDVVQWYYSRTELTKRENIMLKKDEKAKVIKKLKKHKSDTGSPEVQVGLLTERITQLTDHLKTNKKDHHSRRGLLRMVAERKKQLIYLKNTDEESYEKVTKKLKIKTAE